MGLMGRGRKLAHGNGTRKRKRIRSRGKGRCSDESDEDYVIEPDDESSEEFEYGNRTRKRKRERIRSRRKGKGSDDSDEDYVVGEDESEEDNSEEYSASSDREDSEENFDVTATSYSGDSLDVRRKVGLTKSGKGGAGWTKFGAKRRKCRASSVLVDSDDDDDDDEEEEEDEDEDEEFMPDADDCLDEEEGSRVRRRRSRVQNQVVARKGYSRRTNAKRKMKKNKPKKKKTLRGRQRRFGSKKVISDDEFVEEDGVGLEERRKKKGRRRKKRAVVHSDSDFVVSGSSDFEYTASEERRDFIRDREKNGLSGGHSTCSPWTNNKNKGRRRRKRRIVHSDSDFVDSESSDFEYTVSEEERDFIREQAENENIETTAGALLRRQQINEKSSCPQQRTMAKKGKEKVDDFQLDTGKQVCGICLSEERRGIIRGTLNSCFHYFCFTCIMEWSKVESRCPVCKQRFTTISKPAKLVTGIGLRNTVIRIPRRDQVYRPSEEELRGYLDPYENVVCMECQQGGDDSLMLLCDICDSPAHTYCVGLGREVPEGNWYCEGCKSSDPVFSNSHVQNLVSNQNTGNSGSCTDQSASGIGAEVFKIRLSPRSTSQQSVPLPEQLFSPGIDSLASPRCPVGEDIHLASPLSGAGASTVLERRRIRQRIHNLMSQFTEMSERNNGLPHATLVSDVATSEVEQSRIIVENAKSQGSADSRSVAVEDKIQDIERLSNCCGVNLSCASQSCDAFSTRMSRVRKPVIYDLNTTPSNGLADDSFSAEQEEMDSLHTALGDDQSCQPIVRSSAHLLPHTSGEGCSSFTTEEAKEQVRAMVKRHLKILARDTKLEHSAFKDVVRCSTNAILAACGFEHGGSAILPVQPPPHCFHIEKEVGLTDLIKGCCSSCFDSFVSNVILRIMSIKHPQ